MENLKLFVKKGFKAIEINTQIGKCVRLISSLKSVVCMSTGLFTSDHTTLEEYPYE